MNKENCSGDKNIYKKNNNLSKLISIILEDSKAEEINIIDVEKKISYADKFIVATCRSSRHASATADQLTQQLKKRGVICPSPEGRPQCDWVIVDAGSVIVHIFRPEIREYYNIEKLWDMSFDLIENNLS